MTKLGKVPPLISYGVKHLRNAASNVRRGALPLWVWRRPRRFA
jgi:hypothetical protein